MKTLIEFVLQRGKQLALRAEKDPELKKALETLKPSSIYNIYYDELVEGYDN